MRSKSTTQVESPFTQRKVGFLKNQDWTWGQCVLVSQSCRHFQKMTSTLVYRSLGICCWGHLLAKNANFVVVSYVFVCFFGVKNCNSMRLLKEHDAILTSTGQYVEFYTVSNNNACLFRSMVIGEKKKNSTHYCSNSDYMWWNKLDRV